MLTASGQMIGIAEAASAPAPAGPPASRLGLESDVPRGGSSDYNPGGVYPNGAERRSFMDECAGAYEACPPLSAAVDVTARTVTAGGLEVVPDDDNEEADETAPPREVLRLRKLLKFVNEREDIRQLLRGVAVDVQVFGDAFLEVVWLLGEPVGLYSLPANTMTVEADEHGTVTGYSQRVDTHPEAIEFSPNQVIHIPGDSVRGSLYGLGIVQKAFWPIATYLFAAALLKERMRRGDPPDLHADAPLEVPENELKTWKQQYKVMNVGAANIGNPIISRGGFNINELRTAARSDLVAIQTWCRDSILNVAGVPPAQVGIIESGNLGGGTGTSQFKTFRINTCGPLGQLILEKLNYFLLRAFGISGWHMELNEVDYRDDLIIEQIRDIRLRNGSWTLNELRGDIGEPPQPYGDNNVVVERSYVMSWDLMQAYSQSMINKNNSADAAAPPAPGEPGHAPPEEETRAPSFQGWDERARRR
ncbi:phage portal protein [Actinomycetospora endophytica]|uniref:Phage portal protein n=1 Tax=Actinomycetospora endophytica TaxID=2291215 RepID=A0ABS8P5U4_9PSEU|nr:phage portal protein [Actinomycetospora endophytica]MCD2193504.1 phage portal protein [Actinomycetospora endophytica]